MYFLLLLALLSCSANGGQPSQDKGGQKKKLLLFGDSLSDQGNLFALTSGQLPNSSIYFNGRFSNGPVWTDYLNDGPAFQVTNYAISVAPACGDQTEKVKAFIGPAAPMQVQIENFLRGEPPAGPTNLLDGSSPDVIILEAGTNDYLLAFLTVSDSINDTPSLLEALRTVRSILELPKRITRCIIDSLWRILPTNRAQSKPLSVVVFGIPNIGFAVELPLVPKELEGPIRTVASAISRLHNELLQARIRSLQFQMGKRGVSLWFFNLSAFLGQVEIQADSLGLTVKDKPCVVYDNMLATTEALSVCENGAEHLFYDLLHPSTIVHKALADEIAGVVG